MRPRAVILLLAAASALALAGCGAQGTAQPAATDRVELPKSYRFDPAVITVSAGTTVSWHNSDNFTHSVSVIGGGFPFLHLPPGASGSITFDRPGRYHYVCTYHAQNMQGTVIVTSP